MADRWIVISLQIDALKKSQPDFEKLRPLWRGALDMSVAKKIVERYGISRETADKMAKSDVGLYVSQLSENDISEILTLLHKKAVETEIASLEAEWKTLKSGGPYWEKPGHIQP